MTPLYLLFAAIVVGMAIFVGLMVRMIFENRVISRADKIDIYYDMRWDIIKAATAYLMQPDIAGIPVNGKIINNINQLSHLALIAPCSEEEEAFLELPADKFKYEYIVTDKELYKLLKPFLKARLKDKKHKLL